MKNEWLGQFYVAPLVGAWIEIKAGIGQALDYVSLLSWERGLKYSEQREL